MHFLFFQSQPYNCSFMTLDYDDIAPQKIIILPCYPAHCMNSSIYYIVYLLFGGPPLTTPPFFAPSAALNFAAGFFPGLGSFTPSTRSILTII
mmetsp:Transcript_28706/g.43353  ORF Transcript_28706/g.43353 Transcript_28706/m.43353 type:complete len:93 (-) Transcript_28706:422-700(-)